MIKQILLSILFAVIAIQIQAKTPEHTFSIGRHDFILDGKPFQIISGEMHYARVPRPYWRDRLKKAKAMGLNTICTYMFWNAHEPQEGHFNFSDNLDISAFCKVAQEEGLWVIIRPGPYTCAEWDLGGLPSWLLKNKGIVMRTDDPLYLKPALTFLQRAAKTIRPSLITAGGNVLMVQVENEYGVYGNNKPYLTAIKHTLENAGIDVPLFHCDWAGKNYFDNGHIAGVMPSINFGGDAQNNFAIFDKYAPDYPKFNSEFWTGWFDYWGGKHEVHTAKDKLDDFKWMIDKGISVNLYMFHGGTNTGFSAGANGSNTYFTPYTTSYDYDAPLNEGGEPNEKYYAFRDVILQKYPELKLPVIPSPMEKISIPEFTLTPYASLENNTLNGGFFAKPQNIEALGQANGLIVYKHRFAGKLNGTLRIDRVMDRASVYIDGAKLAILDRRLNQSALNVSVGDGQHLLEIVVEPMGRVNFGSSIDQERKGITQAVYFNNKEITGWQHDQLPLTDINAIKPSQIKTGYPAFYKGSFVIGEVGDTYFDTGSLDKGILWVNGRLIGRYWFIGPQQTLYIPGCWLKKGKNEIKLLEMGSPKKAVIRGVTSQVWKTVLDSALFHRKAGQEVILNQNQLANSGQLADKDGWQQVKFDKIAHGRYVCLQSSSVYGNVPYTSVAEFRIVDERGVEIPREEYKLIYADSEELAGENGLADLMIDNQPTTYWHTEWGEKKTGQPHQVIIDLGKERTIQGFRYLARMKERKGRIKDYLFYLSTDNFLKP